MKPRNRALCGFVIAGLAATASANGAMGYALEIFEFRVWTIYVAAMVLLEAWIIGRGLGFGWVKSLFFSALFNAITAYTCAGGFFAAALHHGANPNPLFTTVWVLALFGLVSALIEGYLWRFPDKSLKDKPRMNEVYRRSLLAHAIGIPVALVILLSPPRPYPGIEAVAEVWRQIELRSTLRHAYGELIGTSDNGDAQFRSIEELQKGLAETSSGSAGEVALMVPEYSRFAMGQTGTQYLKVEFSEEPASKSGWRVRVYYDKLNRYHLGLAVLENSSVRPFGQKDLENWDKFVGRVR